MRFSKVLAYTFVFTRQRQWRHHASCVLSHLYRIAVSGDFYSTLYAIYRLAPNCIYPWPLCIASTGPAKFMMPGQAGTMIKELVSSQGPVDILPDHGTVYLSANCPASGRWLAPHGFDDSCGCLSFWLKVYTAPFYNSWQNTGSHPPRDLFNAGSSGPYQGGISTYAV